MGAAFQTYDFTLAAGGSIQIPAAGEFFRVQSATGKVDVISEFGLLKGLTAGQGARSPFQRLAIKDASGAANSGTIIVGSAEFIDNQLILAAGGAIALDAMTISKLAPTPPTPSGWYISNTTQNPNIATQIVAPSANLNGLMVIDAAFSLTPYSGQDTSFAFVAQSAAPTSLIDGLQVLGVQTAQLMGAQTYACAKLGSPIMLPAGLGLYFVTGTAYANGGTGNYRSCSYKIL